MRTDVVSSYRSTTNNDVFGSKRSTYVCPINTALLAKIREEDINRERFLHLRVNQPVARLSFVGLDSWWIDFEFHTYGRLVRG
jgi:hypothetical protein